MAEAVPKDLENFILTRIDDLFFDVNTFQNEVNKQVSIMMGNGMSSAQIETIMAQNWATGTGPFGQLQNNTTAKVTETINQSSRRGMETEYSDKDKFAWVTVGGHRICVDCDGRSGEILTYEEWESAGVPGSGWSVCQGYCYCVLDPTGKTGKSVNVDTSKIAPEKGTAIRRKGPFIPVKDNVAAARGALEFGKASRLEPLVTKDIKKIGKKNNMKNSGLKYKLKDEPSIIRKIKKESLENGWNIDEVITKDLRDTVRYTYVVDDATYLRNVRMALDDLEAAGYEIKKLSNYWAGKDYKGLNVALREKTTGRMIEVQFNTARSQYIKDAYSHKLYEKIRKVGISASEKAKLKAEMRRHWQTVTPPPGWEEIIG